MAAVLSVAFPVILEPRASVFVAAPPLQNDAPASLAMGRPFVRVCDERGCATASPPNKPRALRGAEAIWLRFATLQVKMTPNHAENDDRKSDALRQTNRQSAAAHGTSESANTKPCGNARKQYSNVRRCN